jgi:hypothetical protein
MLETAGSVETLNHLLKLGYRAVLLAQVTPPS